MRSKSVVLIEGYRQTCNKVDKFNKELKREFFTHKMTSQHGELKRAWKTIYTVLNKKSKITQIAALEVDGSRISDSKSIAKSMNTVFCSIGNTLSGNIPETSNPLLKNEYSVNS